MAQQRLVSKLEFAARAGVSKPAISKALKGELRAALVGERLNIDHPAAAAYLRKHGKATGKPATARAPTRKRKAPRAAPAAPTEGAHLDEEQLAEPTEPRPGARSAPQLKNGQELEILVAHGYEDLTIREVAERWGTLTGYADFVDVRKTISETTKVDLQNEEKRGSVISREMVHKSIFGALDGMFSRLLGDMPRTITGRLYALAVSGAPREQAEQETRNLISSQLLPVKARAAKALREPLAKPDD
jgi:hypothetical protein